MIRRRLMMLKKSSGGLPEGYTAVDYIQTSGSQRIDTGVKSSASVGLSADFCFVDARSNQNLAQTYSDSEHYLLMVLMISSWGSPDGAAWFVCGYNAVQYFKKADTDRHVYHFNADGQYTVEMDGTIDNPITAAAGMRYYKDLYYLDGGKTYRCIRDDSNGQGTILHYVPSQLVGIYFEEAK